MHYDYNGYTQPVLLRGPTVDILALLSVGDTQFIVHVDQYRPAVGQIVRSNPAGMIDDGEEASVSALRELTEETDIEVRWSKPLNLNEVLYGVEASEEDASELVSPGASDESTTFFVVTAEVTDDQLAGIEGKLAGLASEGESITLHLTNMAGLPIMYLFPKLRINGGRADMKTSHSLMMYEFAMQKLDYEDRMRPRR
jgi:8-oxo-dGTP pyrophosphatase MutT (NUDIX family)